MRGPSGRQRVALGLGGMAAAVALMLLATPPVVAWLGQWGRTPLGAGLFLEEGRAELRLRHLGSAPARVEMRAGADEGLALVPGPALFELFGDCVPEPDGRAARLTPGGACRLVWTRPPTGPQALALWWRPDGGPWRLAEASRRFPTEAGLLRIQGVPEGAMRLRLAAALAPPPRLDDGSVLPGWRCGGGACEGVLGASARLQAPWLPDGGLALRREASGGLRWAGASVWDAQGRAEVVVENVSAEARPRPLPVVFGAALEQACPGPLGPGEACAMRLRRTGAGPAAAMLEEAGTLALAP